MLSWAALRASSDESRFEALHATGLTALVGREEELELLLRRWARAKSGEGQVVLLSGEAGIGKVRQVTWTGAGGSRPSQTARLCSPDPQSDIGTLVTMEYLHLFQVE